MATEPSPQKSSGSNPWPWALAVGLLAGYLVGREVGPRGGGTAAGGSDRAEKTADSGKGPGGEAAGPAKVYKSESEFPAGWMKSGDMVRYYYKDAGQALRMMNVSKTKLE